MPPRKAKKRNLTLHPSNDHNIGEKRPYAVMPVSMEAAAAPTPKLSKRVSKPSSKKSVSAEDQCNNPMSKGPNSVIPESPETIARPVCENSGFDGSAATETEKKIGMTVQQEKFVQELEKLVKMGQMTAAVIHESTTAAVGSLDPNHKEEGKEAAYWKARFEEMSNLRLTEPEKELESYRKHAGEKARAQDELIQELRRCNTLFSEDNLKLVAPAADASIPTTQEAPPSPCTNESPVPQQSSVDALEAKLARKRTLLALYQQLTGICIKFKEEGWIECTALNHLHKRTLQFNLSIPEDSTKEVNFRPGANSHILPSYMQHSLVFERNQSPLFLVKILTNLFCEERVE